MFWNEANRQPSDVSTAVRLITESRVGSGSPSKDDEPPAMINIAPSASDLMSASPAYGSSLIGIRNSSRWPSSIAARPRIRSPKNVM